MAPVKFVRNADAATGAVVIDGSRGHGAEGKARVANLTVIETQVRVAPQRVIRILGEVTINCLELVSHVIEASHERIMPKPAAARSASGRAGSDHVRGVK